jgi:hypothetical protein
MLGLAILENPGSKKDPNWLDEGLGLRRRRFYWRKKDVLMIADELGTYSGACLLTHS